MFISILYMFQAAVCPSSGELIVSIRHLVYVTLYRWPSGAYAFGRGRAGRPDDDQQHCYHHAPAVKPEAATGVAELLMMGVRTPETCW